MAVANSLVAKDKEKEKMEVNYIANGEEVRLTAPMVKKYLVSGDPDAVTDQEVMMFISLCKYQHLNPFLREAYLVKYGTRNPATMVTGKDTFLKRAERNEKYRGKASGIVIQTKDGKVEYRDGTLKLDGEKIVGGWAKIYIEGREPEMTTVSFEEYVGKKSDGTVNGQWSSKPATMIRKVAVVQALREAFPDDFGGLYSPEEMGEAAEVIPDQDTPVEVQAEAKVVEEAPEKKPTKTKQTTVADVLFE